MKTFDTVKRINSEGSKLQKLGFTFTEIADMLNVSRYQVVNILYWMKVAR